MPISTVKPKIVVHLIAGHPALPVVAVAVAVAVVADAVVDAVVEKVDVVHRWEGQVVLLLSLKMYAYEQ